MKAQDLYGAKCLAIEHFKVPKSKTHLVAVEPAYENETDEFCSGWIAFYNQKKVTILKQMVWRTRSLQVLTAHILNEEGDDYEQPY